MKPFIFVVLICCVHGSLFAQITLRSGLNFSGIRDKDLIENNRIIGIYFGGEYQVILNPKKNKNLIAQGGAFYSSEGYGQQVNNEKFNYSFFYGSLPVSILYKPTASIGIEAGVAYNRLFKAIYNSKNDQANVTVNYHRNDWRLIAGAVFFEDKPFSLTLRYLHGFNKLITYPDFDNFGNVKRVINDFKNQTLQVGLMYNLRFNENFK